MSRPDIKIQEFGRGFAISGWVIYIAGSLLCAAPYAPSPVQLVLAGLLMGGGLFLLDRHLVSQRKTGWDYLIQRLLYLSTLLLIPGFFALALYGFQPGLVQLICLYGGSLAFVLYGLSFILAIAKRL